MATVVATDYSIATNGDIRYTGTTTNNTVIEFHRWLGDLMDDALAAGNDLLDITDATASERSTDNIITLKAPFNIDDVVAKHLFDGSIIQNNGDEIYDGILVFANAGMYLNILQNGNIVSPNFWTTGLNADAANGISHRFMLKVRTAAADIDGRRIVGQTREGGQTYSEFKINGTSRGNNVLALTYTDDLNDETAAATVKGWTTITNTEGFRALDVNNDTVNENYYSEWNKATFTINQLYERLKWLSRRATAEASNADTGSAFQLANATVIGQAQSFANGVVASRVTRVYANLRKVGSPTGNITAKIYAHSGTFGSSSIPTGAALATSVTVDAAKLTTTYATTEFGFTTQTLLSASTNYVVAFEHAVIDGSNYIEVEGLATSGTHGGNRSQLVSVTWTATAGDDLNFRVDTSPQLYGLSGEVFRGITHEITVDTQSVTDFSAVEAVSWSGGTGQMFAVNDVNAATKMWMQLLTGVAPTDNQTITGGTSAATCLVNVTVTERTLSTPFVGQSTGSAIIGAYGVGIETADLSASDKLTDLTNTLRVPPNNVTFTVNGLVSGEDRVLVAPLGYEFAYDTEAGGSFTVGNTLTFATPTGTGYLSALRDDGTTGRMQIRLLTGSVPTDNTSITDGGVTALVNGTVAASEDPRQLILTAVALTGTTVTTVPCTTAIPTDTPSAAGTTGSIRIKLASGLFRNIAYTSYSGNNFTIPSTDFSADNAPASTSIFIGYIDKAITGGATSASFTSVYSADRSLFIRVRDGASTPIKTFETTGTLGSAGGSSTAIRTSDA